MSLVGRHSGVWRAGTAVMLALAVAACASRPLPTFDLTAPQGFPRHSGPPRGQLVITEPAALTILDLNGTAAPVPGVVVDAFAGGIGS